jgi:hypothetical protein
VGTAELTATLGTIQASGAMTVVVGAPSATPTTPAPTPTVPASDVISLFSNAYEDVPVETWLAADWEYADADMMDETIGSDDVKKYEIRTYAGIQFADPTIDVSGMTHFHMDIWTPNSTASPTEFKVKLVDFGTDGEYLGTPDCEHEMIFTENTAPALATGTWISLDVPLVALDGLLTKNHLAQMIISGGLSIVYVDNIYFYNGGELTAPSIPAPTPTVNSNSVISLFSDVYTDHPIDTWSAIWDDADLEEYQIDSDNVKEYTNFSYAGVVFSATTIDASAMTHLHMNVWTPDATSSPSVFKIKLLDYGPNGVYDYGGNDDVEHEIILDENTMNTGIWVTIDLSLTLFTDLTSRGHLYQMVISGTPNTIYLDNVYFYDCGIPIAPPAAATPPTHDAGDVISLFSDVYTDVEVDTWSAFWDTADVYDYVVASDNIKQYTNLLFAGIEFTTNTIDVSAMTHFHIDVWTPDPTDAPAVFKIKLVDFGPNGVWGDTEPDEDNTEHEIILDESTMSTGEWVGIEIPMAEFVDLTTREHLAQLIISGDPDIVYLDNIYFHK